jgi:DNA-binding NtrC family response regulator
MTREPIKILLVDDEEDFVEMLSLRLEAVGEEVTPAHSGTECLQVLEERDVDVVILDVKMPGMDGIETLQEIKRRFPLVEVILMTGHGTVESAIQGQALGAFDYLLKPADFNELVEKLEAAREKKAEQDGY